MISSLQIADDDHRGGGSVTDPLADAPERDWPVEAPAAHHEQVGFVREVDQSRYGGPRIGDVLGWERLNRAQVHALAPGRRNDDELGPEAIGDRLGDGGGDERVLRAVDAGDDAHGELAELWRSGEQHRAGGVVQQPGGDSAQEHANGPATPARTNGDERRLLLPELVEQGREGVAGDEVRARRGDLVDRAIERDASRGVQLVENVAHRPAGVDGGVDFSHRGEPQAPLRRAQTLGLTGGLEGLRRSVDTADNAVEDSRGWLQLGVHDSSLLSAVSSKTGCRWASATKSSTGESLLAWKEARALLAMPT